MQNSDQQPQIPTTADYWPGSTASVDAPYKRSKKTKKDLLACYDRRIQASAKWRKEEFEPTWKRLIDCYRGKQFSGMSTEDRIMVNIMFSTVNVIVPSVAVNYPKMTVTARSPELDEAAHIVEAAVNYWWRRYDFREEAKRVVKDSLVIGHGWAKVGWKFEQKNRQVTDEERQAQYGEMQGQAQQAAQEDPAVAADLPSDYDIYDALPDHEQEVTADHAWLERVSPFDILIDSEATSVADLKWIAQRIVAPIERIMADNRYSKAARNKLKADLSANPRWRDDEANKGTSEKRNDDIKRVTLYEYWDIEHEFYCVFAKGADDFLLEPTDFPYPFGIPFIPLVNHEVPDQFYPIGDLEMLEPMQNELNAVRSDMMNHRKRWQRAYLALRDKLDPAAQNALISNKDGRIIYVDGDEDLDRIVKPIQQIGLDAQFYNYSNVIEADLQQISAISEYERGVAPEIRRTATEANMIQSASNARVSDKLAVIELFMAKAAQRVIQLAQTYMTAEDVASIVGPNGQQAWVQFSREDIEGEFDFVVDAGSTTPRDEKWRRETALQMLQTLSPFFLTLIDGQKIIARVLQDGFQINNPQDYFVQQSQYRPLEKMLEVMKYSDVPPDIQRQMEEQAGFERSTMGGTSPVEQQAIQHAQDEKLLAEKHAQEQQQLQQQHAQELQQAEQQHQQQKEQTNLESSLSSDYGKLP